MMSLLLMMSRFDQDMCLAHLPKLIQSLMSVLLSSSPSNCDVICNSLKVLLISLVICDVMFSKNSH